MTAPKNSEIEVVLFGPGYGESVLIHTADGSWIVVDSCIDRSTKEPAALAYLKSIGVDPTNAVSLVIATHWHDDHIRGLASVFRTCKSAQFVCPAALQQREFFDLLGSYGQTSMLQSSGVDELQQVYQELELRGQVSGQEICPIYAIENRMILESDDRHQTKVTVEALSPSDLSFKKAIAHFATQLPVAKKTKGRVRTQNPNHAAMVLRVSVGNNSILLGSDLEVVSAAMDGWNRIVAISAHKAPSKVFKVAHHGSINGHHLDAWEKLLSKNAIAILTPFQNGGVVLPKQEDIQRIVGLTDNAFITCMPKNLQVKLQNRVVNDIVSNIITSPITTALPATGYLRIRRDLASAHDDWDVVPVGPAVHLNKLDASKAAA